MISFRIHLDHPSSTPSKLLLIPFISAQDNEGLISYVVLVLLQSSWYVISYRIESNRIKVKNKEEATKGHSLTNFSREGSRTPKIFGSLRSPSVWSALAFPFDPLALPSLRRPCLVPAIHWKWKLPLPFTSIHNVSPCIETVPFSSLQKNFLLLADKMLKQCLDIYRNTTVVVANTIAYLIRYVLK